MSTCCSMCVLLSYLLFYVCIVVVLVALCVYCCRTYCSMCVLLSYLFFYMCIVVVLVVLYVYCCRTYCSMCVYCFRICCTMCELLYMSVAGFTLYAELLARSQYSEGPATGHLVTGFPWFPCVYKQMLSRLPRFQVATTCFSCSLPDLNLNLSLTSFIFCSRVK